MDDTGWQPGHLPPTSVNLPRINDFSFIANSIGCGRRHCIHGMQAPRVDADRVAKFWVGWYFTAAFEYCDIVAKFRHE
jgi:hypothetical protein